MLYGITTVQETLKEFNNSHANRELSLIVRVQRLYVVYLTGNTRGKETVQTTKIEFDCGENRSGKLNFRSGVRVPSGSLDFFL